MKTEKEGGSEGGREGGKDGRKEGLKVYTASEEDLANPWLMRK